MLEKRVFIICPVQHLNEEENEFIMDYISNLEEKGVKVHYPPRDTNQVDSVGLRICCDNRNAVRNADEIHIYWQKKSRGSVFDFGMAFMVEKPIVLINRDMIEKTNYKSFENVLLELDRKYREKTQSFISILMLMLLGTEILIIACKTLSFAGKSMILL